MIDILMIVLVALAGVLALAFAFLFGPPPLPIGIIPMRIMQKHAEEAEQRRIDEKQQRIDDVLEARKARKASDQAKRKGADKAYWDALVAVDRARFRSGMRDRVLPQANRRLRHLMMD